MEERPPLDSFLKSPIQQNDLEPSKKEEGDSVVQFLRGKKGEKGDNGEQGPEGPRGERGFIGLNGEDGKDGKDGKNGKDGIKGEPGERGFVGEKGEPGKDGKDAKDVSVEISGKEVISKINSNKTEKIKASKIEGFKELEDGLKNNGRQVQNVLSLGGTRQTAIKASGVLVGTGINTLNFVGATATKVGDGSEVSITTSGSGQVNSIVAGTGISVNSTDPANPIITNTGTAPSFVDNEVVSGSGTTFTLANTPIVGSVHVHGEGQRLTLTIDYTISGAVITMVAPATYAAGAVLADYRK